MTRIRLSYFAQLLATDTGAHIRRKKRILFCSLLLVFLSQIKHISHGIAFTGIVLDKNTKLVVICKQNDEKMQYIKRGVFIGHACREEQS